jgi:hypothetical protein
MIQGKLSLWCALFLFTILSHSDLPFSSRYAFTPSSSFPTATFFLASWLPPCHRFLSSGAVMCFFLLPYLSYHFGPSELLFEPSFCHSRHRRLAHRRLAHRRLAHRRLAHRRLAHRRLAHRRLAHRRLAHRRLVHRGCRFKPPFHYVVALESHSPVPVPGGFSKHHYHSQQQ